MREVRSGGGHLYARGIWEIYVLPPQVFREPKTALENSLNKKIRLHLTFQLVQ